MINSLSNPWVSTIPVIAIRRAALLTSRASELRFLVFGILPFIRNINVHPVADPAQAAVLSLALIDFLLTSMIVDVLVKSESFKIATKCFVPFVTTDVVYDWY